MTRTCRFTFRLLQHFIIFSFYADIKIYKGLRFKAHQNIHHFIQMVLTAFSFSDLVTLQVDVNPVLLWIYLILKQENCVVECFNVLYYRSMRFTFPIMLLPTFYQLQTQ